MRSTDTVVVRGIDQHIVFGRHDHGGRAQDRARSRRDPGVAGGVRRMTSVERLRRIAIGGIHRQR